MLAWLGRFRGDRSAALPLYEAVVARGREPHWYLAGAVPDTIDGRFDMIAAVLTMVLLRLEADADASGAGAGCAARVTERFVDDMDGQLREIGIGDIVVGKHIGRMMGMLGGRLGAYRDALATDERATDERATHERATDERVAGERVAGELATALVRNLYRGVAPAPAALAHVAAGLTALARALAATPLAAVIAGDLP